MHIKARLGNAPVAMLRCITSEAPGANETEAQPRYRRMTAVSCAREEYSHRIICLLSPALSAWHAFGNPVSLRRPRVAARQRPLFMQNARSSLQ